MAGLILAVNAGSSSLKFALFGADGTGPATARGETTELAAAPHLLAHDAVKSILLDTQLPAGLADPFAAALDALLAFAESHLGGHGLAAVGPRIVHGGADHVAPALITPTLLSDLVALTPLDPLHIPHSLAPVHAVAKARPGLEQAACFDTAFHHTRWRGAWRFPALGSWRVCGDTASTACPTNSSPASWPSARRRWPPAAYSWPI